MAKTSFFSKLFLALFFFLMSSSLAASEDRIDQDTAERVATVDVNSRFSTSRLLFTDIVYEYGTEDPWQYVVVFAVKDEFFDYSRKDVWGLYKKSLSDKSLDDAIFHGFEMVFVSATRERPPIPASGPGFPAHIGAQNYILNAASRNLGAQVDDLTEGGLFYIYYKGIFREVRGKVNKRVFVEIHDPFGVISEGDVSEAMSNKSKESEDEKEKKEKRIKHFEKDWEDWLNLIQKESFGSGSISSGAVAASSTTPIYIANYNHPSLQWSQNEITSTLPCYSTGGCCFAAAPAALMSFWDDNLYQNRGPFEGTVTSGNGTDQSAVSNLASDLYNAVQIFGGCFGFICPYQVSNAVSKVADQKKYYFTTSGKNFPTTNDVISEVTNNRPFIWMVGNYYYNGININHVVTGVGYFTDAINRFRIPSYTNWAVPRMLNIYYDNPDSLLDTHSMVTVAPGSGITHTLMPPTNTTVQQGGYVGPFYGSITNRISSSYSYWFNRYTITPDGASNPLLSATSSIQLTQTLRIMRMTAMESISMCLKTPRLARPLTASN